ncbi:MAG: CDP-glycerol glycerophosphotransferase family protein [Floccifex sp.]
MGLSKLILKICLTLLNQLTFFLKQKDNRITFISLTQNELSSDFKFVNDELVKENYDIHYNLIVFEQNLKGKIGYFFNCLKQLIELKQSKLIILNDNNYVVSNFKPKNTMVLQMWHAPGAIKKFGNQIKRQYSIQNYDYVICNAPYWKSVYSQAFHVNENQVLVTGLPRMDALIHKKETTFFDKYPQCINKKLFLYAPTFRGNIIDGFQRVSMDFDKIHLKEDELILCKFHPLLKDIDIQNPKVINVSHEDLYDLMYVSNCLISDYSSVYFDYCLLKKPMIVFIQDYDAYKKSIGFNVNLYEEKFAAICTNEEQLNQILHSELSVFEEFQKKFVTYTDGFNTQRVVNEIKKMMN